MREFLKGLDLDNEMIDTIMAEHGKLMTRTKEQVETLKGEIGTLKDKLKSFDGVDPAGLQAEIQKLNKQLQDQEAEYNAKIAERDFTDKLTKTITAKRGKDSRAILPFLDLETLRSSKNQDADIDAAVEEVKRSNDYLFESDEPIKNPTHKTGGSGNGGGDQAARRAAARRAMGLPPEERNE